MAPGLRTTVFADHLRRNIVSGTTLPVLFKFQSRYRGPTGTASGTLRPWQPACGNEAE
jgi:hypothetical protein